MSELTAIMLKTMMPSIEKMLDMKCDEYESNPKYKVFKVKDGFCVYHEEDGYRLIDEAHYLGENKFISVRMWKFLSKGVKKMRLIVQKANIKMFEFYKRIGFSVINEDEINYIMER